MTSFFLSFTPISVFSPSPSSRGPPPFPLQTLNTIVRVSSRVKRPLRYGIGGLYFRRDNTWSSQSDSNTVETDLGGNGNGKDFNSGSISEFNGNDGPDWGLDPNHYSFFPSVAIHDGRRQTRQDILQSNFASFTLPNDTFIKQGSNLPPLYNHVQFNSGFHSFTDSTYINPNSLPNQNLPSESSSILPSTTTTATTSFLGSNNNNSSFLTSSSPVFLPQREQYLPDQHLFSVGPHQPPGSTIFGADLGYDGNGLNVQPLSLPTQPTVPSSTTALPRTERQKRTRRRQRTSGPPPTGALVSDQQNQSSSNPNSSSSNFHRRKSMVVQQTSREGGTVSTSGNNGGKPHHGNVSNKIRRQVRGIFERAKEEERNGNNNEARNLLKQCLALDRCDAHSWLALARLEARAGGMNWRNNQLGTNYEPDSDKQTYRNQGTDLARSLFQEGLGECPTSVHLLQAWAVLEHRCGNRDKARELFAKGLEIEPDNPYVCQAWGLLEQRVGNTSKARELFQKSVALKSHPEVCSAWAVLEAREGNIETARTLFDKGLKSCKPSEVSSMATIYRSWAEMEERTGDLPSARDLLSKAIASQPRMTEAYIALGRLEARRGGITRAIELMKTASTLSPKPPAPVFNAWAQITWTAQGRIDEARSLLERGHKLHPKDPALLQTLGTLEEKCGNNAAAKELFNRSVCARPTAPAFVAWALMEERECKYEEAVRLFEQALKSDPLHGAAYNAYGMMEARQGNLDKARAVYERGLQLFASASVWHGYGQLELKIGRNPDRARELFQQGAAQSREDTSFIWHSWGMLELSEKKVLEAREIFQKAMKRYPRNSRVLVGAGLAEAASCHRTGADEVKARDFFKRAVAADPTHAHAWQAWGVFELRRGRVDAAQALFRRGLRLCPSHGALWQAWGVLETSRRNFIRARQLFEKGTAECPTHVHLFQAWACMEVRAGNIQKARELLDHALESDACHGPVWNAYGLLEARHGTLAKARQNFGTGIRRAPHHAPLYRAFGQTEVRAGNYDRARSLFQEGLKVDPRHAPLYHAYAQFEAMMGNVSALADLKAKAEKYFGSEVEAIRAMKCGEGDGDTPDTTSSDEFMDHRYGSRTTPMELALNGDDLLEE